MKSARNLFPRPNCRRDSSTSMKQLRQSKTSEQFRAFSDSFHANEEGENPVGGKEEGLTAQLQDQLALKENRTLFVLRVVVLFILVTAATLMATFAYLMTHRSEVQEFEETFDDYAQQIIRTVQVNAQQKLEAVSAIALQIQSYAIHSNSSWPFVAMPFFEEQVAATKSLTDAYGVLLFPIVETTEREKWEAYSIDNRDWIEESYQFQRITSPNGTDGLTSFAGDHVSLETPESTDWFDLLWGPDYREPDNPDFSQGIANAIFKTRHDDDPENYNPRVDTTKGPYFPQWQAAEMGWYYQSSINLNYGHFADFKQQTEIVRQTQTAVYGEAWTDSVAPGYLSTMLYPVLDQMKTTTTDPNNTEVVAFLSLDIFWEAFLARILPPNSDGIYVVISNACDQVFTYQILGSQVEFVGDQDLHEPQHDDLMQSFLFGEELMEPITAPAYTGRPLYGDFCPYTFSVYPSQQMRDHYVTNKPIIYSVVAAVIVLFTSLVFVAYDVVVERRQHLVMTSAAKADKIVSSLFPNAVKERLYETETSNKNKNNEKQTQDDKNAEELLGIEKPKQPTQANATPEVSPIADLYPETTIMFCDLVGFTAWSSGRTPSDVFLLLETVYGRFDKLAKKRKVFKIETIGDCYVCCTGIPLPQERHAYTMVRFALDSRMAFREEIHKLAEKLGPKTLDLATRTGIHSGPVTGGVLRGEKARFQLFGDTMNTAARMESNGAPSRIHLSETTAKLLRESGKGHWLQPRAEKIIAKGKGEMQPYWIEAKAHSIADIMRQECDDGEEEKEEAEGKETMGSSI